MIKTIFLFVYVALTMIILIPIGIVVLILSFLGLRKPMSYLMYRVAQGWARLLFIMIGCELTVSGRENIPRKGGLCFVSNHNSIFDIVMLLAFAGRPFGFVAKKELLLIPFLNVWISLLGGLFIDRKNPGKALKTINVGVDRIKNGGGILIFPEGHRSRGRGLLPFHPGSLKLATKSGTIIVPIALSGTYEVFEKNYRVRSCPVKITFCPPVNTGEIPPAGRKQLLSDQVFAVINKELNGEAAEI